MPTVDPDHVTPEERKEEVCDFFENWARFEYALKRAGYVVARRDGEGEPVITRGRFSRAIERRYVEEPRSEFAAAVAYLSAHPPKRQQLNSAGDIVWAELTFAPGDSRAWRLLLYLRTVRNNLFHGGKFNDQEVEDPIRDLRLIAACLFAVDQLLLWEPRVARFFSDRDDVG